MSFLEAKGLTAVAIRCLTTTLPANGQTDTVISNMHKLWRIGRDRISFTNWSCHVLQSGILQLRVKGVVTLIRIYITSIRIGS
jgi:hypothetical protein